jgi:acylphosphatase
MGRVGEEHPGETVAARIVVHGRVQGVFFRATAREEARRLGLAGWVRNLPGGSVELVAEGESGAVERMTAWCRRGPPAARVDSVTVASQPPSGLSGFDIR